MDRQIDGQGDCNKAPSFMSGGIIQDARLFKINLGPLKIHIGIDYHFQIIVDSNSQTLKTH